VSVKRTGFFLIYARDVYREHANAVFLSAGILEALSYAGDGGADTFLRLI